MHCFLSKCGELTQYSLRALLEQARLLKFRRSQIGPPEVIDFNPDSYTDSNANEDAQDQTNSVDNASPSIIECYTAVVDLLQSTV